MLAFTLHHPAGPKEESETGGPGTKAVLAELQTWGKTDKTNRHSQRNVRHTDEVGLAQDQSGPALVDSEDRTATMHYSSLCPL